MEGGFDVGDVCLFVEVEGCGVGGIGYFGVGEGFVCLGEGLVGELSEVLY